jgi:hypothetical protein
MFGDVRSGDSYAVVLLLLLASLVVAIVAPETTLAHVVRDVVLSLTIVVAYWTASARKDSSCPACSCRASPWRSS